MYFGPGSGSRDVCETKYQRFSRFLLIFHSVSPVGDTFKILVTHRTNWILLVEKNDGPLYSVRITMVMGFEWVSGAPHV